MALYEELEMTAAAVCLKRNPSCHLTVRFDPANAPPRNSSDIFILRDKEGTLCGKLPVGDAVEVEGARALCFTGLDPQGVYSLFVRHGKVELPLFENKKYGAWK